MYHIHSALIGGLLADCTGLLCTSFQFGSIQGCVKAVSQLTWRLRMGPRLDTSRVGATGKTKLQLHPLTARHTPAKLQLDRSLINVVSFQ